MPFKSKGRSIEEGLDCWGLLIEVGKFYNIDIPDFEVHCFNHAKIISLVDEHRKEWIKVDEPEKGVVVGMARAKQFPNSVQHFGMCINNRQFIHTTKDTGVIITSLDNMMYKNSIKGFYKWNKNQI